MLLLLLLSVVSVCRLPWSTTWDRRRPSPDRERLGALFAAPSRRSRRPGMPLAAAANASERKQLYVVHSLLHAVILL